MDRKLNSLRTSRLLATAVIVGLVSVIVPTTHAQRSNSDVAIADELARLREATIRDLDGDIKKADQAIESLVAHAKKFTARMKELLNTEDGKRLATDAAALQSFMLYQEQPISNATELAAKKKIVKDIAAKLKTVLANDGVGFSETITHDNFKELVGVINWAESKERELAARDTLIADAISNAASEDISKVKSLSAAVSAVRSARQKMIDEATYQAREQNEATIRQQELQAQLDLRLRESQNELAELKATIEAMTIASDKHVAELEQELAKARAEVNIKRAETAAIEQEGEQKADRILQLKKLESREVKGLLQPFLAHSYWQPGNVSRGSQVKKGPISLKALKASGALEPTNDGLSTLLEIAARPHAQDDRPRWGFGKHKAFRDLTPDDLDKLTEAQGYLIELGEVMVSEGMLAP